MAPSSLGLSAGGSNATVNIDFTPFFTVGALAVLIWDILSELRRDIYLFNCGMLEKLAMKRIAYSLARFSILAYLMTASIYQIIPQPLSACPNLKTTQVSLLVLAIAFSYLLIFLRIRNAFQNDRYISWVFGLLWVIVVGGSTTIIYGTPLASSASQTVTCAASQSLKIKPFVSAALLGPLLYLCLAYMFISGRLVYDVRMDLSMEHGMKEFVMGMFVPIFGKGLMGEGQAHYLISALVQLVSFIFFLSGNTPSTRLILVDSSIAITSIMACKVYRGSLYKEIRDKLNRKKIHPVALPMNMVSQSVSTCNVAEIRVTKTVEQF